MSKRMLLGIGVIAILEVVLFLSLSSGKEPTFDDLKCDWFEVELTEGYGKGFFPMFLPFEQKVDGEPSRYSFAFPFLLSQKFEWTPDNICTRHPFFVYKRDRRFFSDYGWASKAFISNYARRWRATHVIGGKIECSDGRWGGHMDVYDRTAKSILSKDYEKQYEYFELMGKMVEDWMAFRKQDVSEGLKEELELPMTSDMKTVKYLELAALMEERSKQEWGIYDAILKLDPDFAEVRQWRANQTYWLDGDREKMHLELGRALDSHLAVMAFTSFSTSRCPNKDLSDAFVREWEPRMAKIAPKHVSILDRRISYFQGWGKWNVEKLEDSIDLLDLAKEHCYHGSFLSSIAESYEHAGMLEKAIPMYINSLRSGYLWGSWEPEKDMFDAIARCFEKKGEKDKAEIARKLKKKRFPE